MADTYKEADTLNGQHTEARDTWHQALDLYRAQHSTARPMSPRSAANSNDRDVVTWAWAPDWGHRRIQGNWFDLVIRLVAGQSAGS